jgi:hypothetical protein
MNAADAVQAVALACNQALDDTGDDMSRVLMLEALANYKAVPLTLFPPAVLDLVKLSHDQADALNDRILASRSLSDPRIEREIRAVCNTLDSLGEALRQPSAVIAGDGG